MDFNPLLNTLRAELGPSQVLTSDNGLDLQAYEQDWRGRARGRALAVVRPGSALEVAVVVKACAAAGVSLVPQGGNTGLALGSVPDDSGQQIVLSLRRLQAIRQLDTANLTLTAEAGCVLQDVQAAATASGCLFPLSLASEGSCTLGGNLATNAGGTQVLRYGNARELCLGLEVVTAAGEIWQDLSGLRKDNTGYDLRDLFIGSEGTLGIITAATLALVPGLVDRRVVWGGVASIQAARTLLLHAEKVLGEALEGFEVVPHSAMEAVEAYSPTLRNPLESPHAWYALIEVVADNVPQADTLDERVAIMLAEAFDDGLLADAAIARNEAQAEAFWGIRETVPAAERAKGPAKQHDIAVPVEAMPDFITAASATVEAAFPGCHTAAFGHLGDGNVHFHVIAPAGAERAAWEAGEGKAVTALVHDLVTQWGGSISAEHGIGQMKVDDLARLADPAALSLMRAVKTALDPAGLLNPGKLVPRA